MRSHLAILLIVIITSCISVGNGSNYFQVDDVTMTLQNGDALIQINYTLSSFARLYVLALGCRHLEPDLNTVFSNFSQVKTIMADPDHATIRIKNAGNYTTGYYLYDSKKLGARVKRFTVVYPEGTSRTFYNVSATPNVFLQANSSNYYEPMRLDVKNKTDTRLEKLIKI